MPLGINTYGVPMNTINDLQSFGCQLIFGRDAVTVFVLNSKSYDRLKRVLGSGADKNHRSPERSGTIQAGRIATGKSDFPFNGMCSFDKTGRVLEKDH